jgi:hypothetical protein
MLTKGYFAMVDDEDYEMLSKFKWYANIPHRGGVRAFKNATKANNFRFMHRMIMGVTDPKVLIDHIDHNPLNNQKRNLRLCNDSQSACNTRSAKNSTSKYLGVSFHCVIKNYKTKQGIKTSRSVGWRATIFKNYKQIYIGRFQSEKEAALAYNKKAIELHGEFANLNIILI